MTILYCATHAAAFEMREALKEIVAAFDISDAELERIGINPTARPNPTFLDICKHALALAEGWVLLSFRKEHP